MFGPTEIYFTIPSPFLQSMQNWLHTQVKYSVISFLYIFVKGTDDKKTINVAVSSRALFNLEEENDLFVEQGLEKYIKMQVQREDKLLDPGAAFPFIKVSGSVIH